jgi:hypothetical protein
LQKNWLLFIPFIIGILLFIFSWYLSYPLSIDSLDDSIPNHISILYWFSLPFLLSSMFLMAITFENKILKWILAVGIVLTLYSLSFFYYMLPGVDEHFFRGLSENFILTGNLAIFQPIQEYYQWPLFFILAKIFTSVSGFGLVSFEFLIYAIIGFLLTTAIFIYTSKKYPRSSCLAVFSFFIAMFYFLNYQAAPFTLALALLFIVFTFTLEKLSIGSATAIIILYLGIIFTHVFVPLFLIFYLLTQSIVSKSKGFFALFLITLGFFLLYERSVATDFFFSIINRISSNSEYSSLAGYIVKPVVIPLDMTAQIFSRAVTLFFLLLSVIGFVILLIKMRLRAADKSIFLTGVVYFCVGLVIFTLGSRAIAIAFIPISLGVSFLFETKLRKYLIPIILVFLIIFAFIPLHTSFTYSPIAFQTKEEYRASTIMIEKYNWGLESTLLAHISTYSYILPQVKGNFYFASDVMQNVTSFGLERYDCIIYSIGLERTLGQNYSVQGAEKDFNILYDSGSYHIAFKSGFP